MDAVTNHGSAALAARTVAPFGTYPPNTLHTIASAIGHRLPGNWLGRRASGLLRSLLRRTTHRPVDVTVLGQRMRLCVQDNACERRLLVSPQFFGAQELKILQSRITSDFHFVDLGANVGVFSIFVGLLAGPRARILAIEPQRAVLERLRENLALNGLEIMIAPVAVADREDVIEFAVDLHNLGRTSLNLARTGPRERCLARLPVRTLLALVREHGFARVDALKIDIEGAEDLALLPYVEQAPRGLWPRLIIMEDNRPEWRRDCIAELVARGYHTLLVSDGNVLLSLPD